MALINMINNHVRERATHSIPLICDDAGQGCVQVVFTHVFPVQHDPHPFSRDSSHGVIMVPKQRNTNHWHTVVHGLIDAVQAAVTQEGPCVGMTLKKDNSCYLTSVLFIPYVY